MGQERNVKLIRKQLRNVVQELLPTLVTEEVKSEMHKKFEVEANQRLNNITETVKKTLDMIDQRSKDTQGYLVRQSSQAGPAQVGEISPLEAPKTE